MKKEGENKILHKIFFVLGSIISIFFIIMGVLIAVDNFGRNIGGTISGVLYFIAGVVIFPKIKLKGWIKGIIFLILVIIAEII